jgi:ADP-ribosyl-[dinitrogen reductase] hydrolase
MQEDILDRARGCLLGLAVGDALGTTLEFSRRDQSPWHADMTGGGPFGLQPGQWTDDTSMALALAESLLACQGLNQLDLMERFTAWYETGAYSCTGICFDIGSTTRQALQRFRQTGNPIAGSTSESSAGNGSLMRVAPVALYALANAESAALLARAQSSTTHAAPQAVEACDLFVDILRSSILTGCVPSDRKWIGHSAVVAVVAGNWRTKSRDEISSSGYVVDTLEAALWSVGKASGFEEALLTAVNLGDDADTVGAVAGQLAGAIWGVEAIPQRWLGVLCWRERIYELATRLVNAGAAGG